MSDDFERAAHLVSPRWGYDHHGLYLGEGKVVHYSGYATPGVVGKVEVVDLQDFALCNRVWLVKHDYIKYSRDQCIQRAYTRLGEDRYDLFGNNCEHFVLWCIEDAHMSGQVEGGSALAAGLGVASGAGAAVGTVTAAGAMYGLSASGIMSGLATVGGVVGGGAAAGIGLLAAAPAVATAGILWRTLYKLNDGQPPSEIKARQAGVVVTAVAGAAGGVGTVGAISALGAVTGLSAAGITSGLAALGGSMIGGVVVAAAAPAIVAAVVGYGAYKVVGVYLEPDDPELLTKLPKPTRRTDDGSGAHAMLERGQEGAGT